MKLSTKDLGSAVVRLATKRLIGRSLQLRRKYAGFLLNSIRCIKSIALKTQDDLGKGCHTQTTESTDVEIVAIVTLRAAFEGSIEEARQALAECDLG